MERKDVVGVPIIFTDADEALRTDWLPYRQEADVVRIVWPPRERWPEIVAAGFLVKPDRVTWVAESGSDDADFLSRLDRKERQTVRAARRRCADAGLRMRTETVEPSMFEAFLELYDRQVAGMRHGLDAARMHRERMLSRADDYLAVNCYDTDGKLVGGCIGQVDPAQSLFRLRFSAVDGPMRHFSLARVLYLQAIGVVRERGIKRVSLGNDPNLYGHVARPGLFCFKVALGFTAVPSRTICADDGEDHADLVVGLRALDDPAFLLSYDGDQDKLRMDLFTSRDGIDLRPLRAPFVSVTRMHHLAANPQ